MKSITIVIQGTPHATNKRQHDREEVRGKDSSSSIGSTNRTIEVVMVVVESKGGRREDRTQEDVVMYEYKRYL